MYAIIELGGRQWKVETGTQFDINRVSTEVGGRHSVERVLLAHDGQALQVGRPYVQGAKVVCEVLAHRLGPKVISYHFRRRENWRKTVGHRQPLSRLVVKEIVLGGGSAVAEAPAKAIAKPKASAPKPVKSTPTKVAVTRPSKEAKKAR